MPRFLIIKLDGVMQGWGGHTYEDWRPSELFPTRSGLLGLLGACLGFDRQDTDKMNELASSVLFTVQAGKKRFEKDSIELTPLRLCDYHTILEARKVDGKPNKNPVQSYRWYLFDSPFLVAIEETEDAKIKLEAVADAVRKPHYTPFLGRRSCPISRPLLDPDTNPIIADTPMDALSTYNYSGTVTYSESISLANENMMHVRDVPVYGRIRQFMAREVYIHVKEEA